MSKQLAVLLLGSNLGDRKHNIDTAIKEISATAGSILTKSEILESEPVEFASSNYFCNIALNLETSLSPACLLHALKTIEIRMGRLQDSGAKGVYEDRVIDIDIVSYGNIKFISKKLMLPHVKHSFEREFSRKVLDDLNQKTKLFE